LKQEPFWQTGFRIEFFNMITGLIGRNIPKGVFLFFDGGEGGESCY